MAQNTEDRDDSDLSAELKAHLDRRIRRAALQIAPVIFVGLYFLMAYNHATDAQSYEQASMAPEPTVEVIGDTTVLKLYPDYRGHFMLDVTLNGIRVPMVLDTGATGMSISQTLAQQVGVVETARGYSETANGRIPVSFGQIRDVVIGPFKLHDVETTVRSAATGDIALLGMGVLRHFDVTVTREYATLVPRL